MTSEGEVPCFSHSGAPAGGELAVSPCGGAGVRLGRGKTSPGHGDCVCGVKVASWAVAHELGPTYYYARTGQRRGRSGGLGR